ncbi:MAG: hypothetical protein ABR601_05005 [Parasphingopyxis sp.]
MAVHLTHTQIQARGAGLVAPPALRPNRAPRAWDLHPAVHLMVAAAFFAFVGILGAATMDQGLVVPFAIFIAFLASFFAVPWIFARVAQQGEQAPFQSWQEFLREGIDTASGHLDGREILIQVLTFPALLVMWSAFVAIVLFATH